MSVPELKKNFHKLIDNAENEALLSQFYNLMEKALEATENSLWSQLSDAEKRELIQIDDTLNHEGSVISHSKIREKHKKWL